jgi:hypothetical protein
MRLLIYALVLSALPAAPLGAQATDPLAPGEHEVELRDYYRLTAVELHQRITSGPPIDRSCFTKAASSCSPRSW